MEEAPKIYANFNFSQIFVFTLKLNIEQGLLYPSQHGDISIFENDLSSELRLGSVIDGKFVPSSYLSVDDDWLSVLRSELWKAYFGEIEMYNELQQDEWSDSILAFMEMEAPDLGDLSLWHKLDSLPEESSGIKRRYQKSDGCLLNGLYAFDETCYLINMGVCLWRSQLSSSELEDLRGDALGCDRFIQSHVGQWLDVFGNEVSFDQEKWRACCAGDIEYAEVFVGRRLHMIDFAEKAEASDLRVEVFPHQNDEQKFMLRACSRVLEESFVEKAMVFEPTPKAWESTLSLIRDADSKAWLDLRPTIEDAMFVEIVDWLLSGVPEVLIRKSAKPSAVEKKLLA